MPVVTLEGEPLATLNGSRWIVREVYFTSPTGPIMWRGESTFGPAVTLEGGDVRLLQHVHVDVLDAIESLDHLQRQQLATFLAEFQAPAWSGWSVGSLRRGEVLILAGVWIFVAAALVGLVAAVLR